MEGGRRVVMDERFAWADSYVKVKIKSLCAAEEGAETALADMDRWCGVC